MSLDRLRTFLHVYREGSMGRAAAALGLTQPGVSAQIKALEHELGTPLFERRNKGVVPTEAAEGLAREVAASVDGLEQAVTSRVARTQDIAGLIRLGAPPELFSVYGPTLTKALNHPGLDIRIRLGNRTALHGGLGDGSLDLAVTASKPTDATFGFAKIGAEQLCLVGHPSVGAELDAPMIAYDDDYSLIANWFASNDPDRDLPAPKVIVGDLRAVRDIASELHGWTVLPRYLIEDELKTGRLKSLDTRTVQNAFYLVWKRSRLRTPRVAFARDQLAGVSLG